MIPEYILDAMEMLERRSVKALWSISGRFDLLAEATAPTTEEINKLLVDLGNIEGVTRTVSHVALATKFERR